MKFGEVMVCIVFIVDLVNGGLVSYLGVLWYCVVVSLVFVVVYGI